ncbi:MULTISPECIES: hypothetical protein [unclassified Luteibacter]|uniref:hypothetical protein n=1 Tax=unclassified Luteibacter TaxID=2620188 RepID=UPI0008CB499A|nr:MULTISPECIES: hypothetical protein [unclassified Luteibacter]MDR6936951.1 hypothetical protein [Luteibacter sp. 3190]SEP07131.1 hypothetical protein SAMN02800692_3539 [Luteibacter sp. UNC138MFCol5.1]
MPYDRSWMGYGIVGALQAGAIALAVGIVVYGLLHRLNRGNGWSHGKELAVAFALSVVLAAGQDMWNLFYFNMAPLQSLTLLKLKLAAVHDPDAIGLRVFFEWLGALVGVGLGWVMFSGDLKKLIAGIRHS